MRKINTGIWLDFKEAYILTIDENWQTEIQHLMSEVEHHAVKGGTRSKTPWGPQYSPRDRHTLEQDKHSEQQYFGEIISLIDPETESIVIFGPAEAKIGLKKAVEALQHYKPQLLAVLPSDYMTTNEIRALMIDFFKNPETYIKSAEKEQ